MTAALAPPASRNAPCPCGSGKRYKDCHGALHAAAAAPLADTADLLLRQAEQAFARGEPVVAETFWQQVLALDPDHPEALFHFGNRARERDDHAAAIELYERALRRAQGHPGVLNNLGLALEANGETERAKVCYRAVLARQPQHPDALLNLANLYYGAGRYADAAVMHEHAAAVRRSVSSAVWLQRALAQERVNDFAGAEASLREAARLSPDNVRIQINLATLYV